MSQIINPERRDPSYLKSKADVGLSKVDNFSAIELQDMVHGALREEYAKGDIYGENEISSSKEFLIPLCKFKEISSRATITVGFIDSSREISSYIRANVKYSFLTSKEKPSSRGGEDEFSVELEAASKRILPGSLRVYKINKKEADLYLYVPEKVNDNKYNLSGVTINITEELITGIGDQSYKNITILDHTLVKFPEDFSTPPNFTVNLNESDRDTSSYTRSLSIYDSEGRIYYPDNFNGEEIDINKYDVPRINGVPFTGDKSLTYRTEEDKEKNLRDITITAKHSGSTKEQAGLHDWEVLKNAPRVGYIPEGNNNYKSIVTLEDYGINSGSGLCNLVPILGDYVSNEGDSIWDSLSKLQQLINNTSKNNDEHVVSIGFLRRYTEILLDALTILAGLGGNSNSSVYFIKKDPEKENNAGYYDPSNAVKFLEFSINYNHYVDYILVANLGSNQKFKLSLKNNNSIILKTEITDSDGNLVSGQDLTCDKDGYAKYTVRIITNKSLTNSELSGLTQLKLAFDVIKVIPGESNTSSEETIRSFSVEPRTIKEQNSIFSRQVEGNTYSYPVIFYEAKPNINSEFIEYPASRFKTCFYKGEVSKETSYGLLWDNVDLNNDNNSVAGCILQSNGVNEEGDESCYKHLFIKLYTTNPNYISISRKDTDNNINVYYNLWKYGSNGFEKLTKTPESGNYCYNPKNDELIEETFDYEKILEEGGKIQDNLNNDEYSYILELWTSRSEEYTPSVFNFVDLGSIEIYNGPDGGSTTTLKLFSRPERLLMTFDDNTSDYDLIVSDVHGSYSRYIPITLNFSQSDRDNSRFQKILKKIEINVLETSGDSLEYFFANSRHIKYTSIRRGEFDKSSGNLNTEDKEQWYFHLFYDGIDYLKKKNTLITRIKEKRGFNIYIDDYIYNNYKKFDSSCKNYFYPDSELLNTSLGRNLSISKDFLFTSLTHTFNPRLTLVRFGGFIKEGYLGYAEDYDYFTRERYYYPDATEAPYYNDDLNLAMGEYLKIGEKIKDKGYWMIDNSGSWNTENRTFRFVAEFNCSDETLSISNYYSNLSRVDDKNTLQHFEDKKESQFKVEKVSYPENGNFWEKEGDVADDTITSISIPKGHGVVSFSWGSGNEYKDLCYIYIYSKDQKIKFLPEADSKIMLDAKPIRIKLIKHDDLL